jgi:uncharacterized protein (DUF1330 family)
MNTINPSSQQFEEFAKAPDDGPFVMINLLKFKEKTENNAESGETAYNRYMMNVSPLLKKAGGRPVWMGSVKQVFIGTPDDKWDRALLVEYPSRKAFLNMISTPEYQQVHKDREAGLKDSVLLATKTE